MSTSRTIVLQGDPGGGKSRMGALTAIRKPVHVIDVDRKIASAGWAADAINKGELTYWELNEALDDSNLISRIKGLGSDLKKSAPSISPKGWPAFADLCYDLVKKPEGIAAGTWMLDSATLANEHAKMMLMHSAGRSKFTFDQWTSLKMVWMQTLSFLRDIARENDKDLIITVHERTKEEAGDRVTGIKLEPMAQPDGGTALQKTYVGQMDVEVWASIDGAFGQLLGAQCDEYYHLYVDATNKDKPEWRCRVWPDGRRSLRTSFMVDKAVHNPNFAEIWRNKK